MKSKKNTSLAEKIANVLNTTPASFDPEDEPIDSTTAQVIANENDDDDIVDQDEEVILSKFRKQNIDLLCDIDTKYAGKKANRKNLEESDEESASSDENDNDEIDEKEDAEEEEEDNELDDEEEEEDNELDDEDEDDQISNYSLSENEQETNFKHMTDSNISSQMKKANCVRNQLSLWENLLEIRIQLQKSLITANKMPQNDHFNEIKQQSGQQFSNELTKTKHNIYNVLDKLLLLQTLLLKQYPETKNLDNPNKNQPTDDDEEIPSDTEPEDSDRDDVHSDAEKRAESVTNKKRKLCDYETALNENHKKYKPYRDGVIQKWNDKTRIAVMKTTTPTHSILNQIEYNLGNKEKLVKKTQLRRNQYQILGEQVTDNNEIIDEYNPNIYDDTDFYHQLLRELIEVKSADITDPVQLGRQWVQLQSLRSKMKRKIDTKATKGRKIRYVVHNKLVNFMAPIDNHKWSDEAKIDLYNSLFGKNQPVVN